MKIRVGFGYDVHALKEGSDFTLGGILLDHSRGAFGHSDADVLIHAICDALLGAANLRDIGVHFPNTDPEYRGVSSLILLQRVVILLRDHNYVIGNIDTTLCLEAPKINPVIGQMQVNIAGACGIETEDVSIKATTNEKLGFIGREEGVAAYAVVLLNRLDQTG